VLEGFNNCRHNCADTLACNWSPPPGLEPAMPPGTAGD